MWCDCVLVRNMTTFIGIKHRYIRFDWFVSIPTYRMRRMVLSYHRDDQKINQHREQKINPNRPQIHRRSRCDNMRNITRSDFLFVTTRHDTKIREVRIFLVTRGLVVIILLSSEFRIIIRFRNSSESLLRTVLLQFRTTLSLLIYRTTSHKNHHLQLKVDKQQSSRRFSLLFIPSKLHHVQPQQ